MWVTSTSCAYGHVFVWVAMSLIHFCSFEFMKCIDYVTHRWSSRGAEAPRPRYCRYSWCMLEHKQMQTGLLAPNPTPRYFPCSKFPIGGCTTVSPVVLNSLVSYPPLLLPSEDRRVCVDCVLFPSRRVSTSLYTLAFPLSQESNEKQAKNRCENLDELFTS